MVFRSFETLMAHSATPDLRESSFVENCFASGYAENVDAQR